MNILDRIIEYKKGEVVQAKAITSIEQLKQMPLFAKPALSLKKFLLDETKTGIIAEYKRQRLQLLMHKMGHQVSQY